MSCRGASCQQGRQACTELCDLSDEAFNREMNRRKADALIAAVGVLALALWAAGVIV